MTEDIQFKPTGRDLKSPAAIQANGPGLEESGSNSSQRDRIARAIAGADSGTLHGVKPCAACQTGDTDQPCDDCLTMAAAVIAALGLREERGADNRIALPDGTMRGADMSSRRRYVTDWEEDER